MSKHNVPFSSASSGSPTLAQLAGMNAQQRLNLISQTYGDSVALLSSFGVQSVVLLSLMKEAGVDFPVVTLDILSAEYEIQRQYRKTLQKHYDFDLRIIPVTSEEQKRVSMDGYLKSRNLSVEVSGIRSVQTDNRAGKSLIEHRGEDGLINVHPILDWSDLVVADYMMSLPEALRHPNYAPGVQSKGGRVLENEEQKTECTLHIPDYNI